MDVNVCVGLLDGGDIDGAVAWTVEIGTAKQLAIEPLVEFLERSLRLVHADPAIDREGDEKVRAEISHPSDAFRPVFLRRREWHRCKLWHRVFPAAGDVSRLANLFITGIV